MRGRAWGAIAVIALGAGSATWWLVRDTGSSTAAAAVPRFADDTASSGIDHRYEGDGEYFEGGGLATLDCDGNGLADLYIAGGAAPAAMYRNASAVGGALRFERLPSSVTDLSSVTGAYPIDIDSDGQLDLVVLRHAEGNRVLRGLGGCRFEDATDALGLQSGDRWTTGFSATWEGANTLPTLAFANYRRPGTTECAVSQLVRPEGDTYGRPVDLAPGLCALSVLFSDWNHTGRHDLRVSNDRNYYRDGGEQLWRIEDGAPAVLYTAADGWQPLQIWGMGIASRDVDGDGVPEVFLTSQGDSKLQQLDADATRPEYHDIAVQEGVAVTRPYTGSDVLPSTAWHPQFADVNNDSYADLFVTKGNVDAQPDYAADDPSDLLIARPGGHFDERGQQAGLASFHRSRGATVSDLNLDGLLDIVVVNREENVSVYRNLGAGSQGSPDTGDHWLGLRLQQPAPNVDAVGAWVEVRSGGRSQTLQLTIGGGHASGELGWIHVGLGGATSADVRVSWPDGTVGPWHTVAADSLQVIDRVAGPQLWVPR